MFIYDYVTFKQKYTSGYSEHTFSVINPATEDVVDEVYRGSERDSFAAVEAAKKALPGWHKMPASERAGILHSVAAKIREHHNELVGLVGELSEKYDAKLDYGTIRENSVEIPWENMTDLSI